MEEIRSLARGVWLFALLLGAAAAIASPGLGAVLGLAFFMAGSVLIVVSTLLYAIFVQLGAVAEKLGTAEDDEEDE